MIKFVKQTSEEKLIVWGARGGLPSSGNEFSDFGQATSCVQLDVPGNNIIFDAGSGIANLGESILKNHDTRPIDIVIGHYHYDHIIGLPFFAPLFSETIKTRIHLPVLGKNSGLSAIDKFLSPPLFPMNRSMFNKNVSFLEFKLGDNINIANHITCRTLSLPHPGLNTAFRVQGKNFDVVYASDVEAEKSSVIDDIAKFSKGTNYIFVDSSYTDNELETRGGWGHFSFQQVVDLAKKIEETQVLIFHHDYLRTDQDLRLILQKVIKEADNLQACKEQSVFKFPK